MSDSTILLIVTAVIFALGLVIAIVKYFGLKKETSGLSVAEFIRLYSDALLALVCDCKDILNLKLDDVSDKEQVALLVDKSIDVLYSQYDEYGIDSAYLKVISKDSLKTILTFIINTFLSNIFPELTAEEPEETDEAAIMEKASSEETYTDIGTL